MAAKNHVENVAIVGAGGNMGSYIVKAMLKEGKHKIIAITRADSSSEMPEGLTVKRVNYDSPDELAEALMGQDALIITLSGIAPPEQQMRLVEAAAAANVRWVMPSWFGPDGKNESLRIDTMLDGHITPLLKRIEELGKSSWICLACSFWYEWSLGGGAWGLGQVMYGFDLRNRTVTFIDDGMTKINTSTWPQAGLAVARLFSLKEKPDGPDDKSPALSQLKNDYVYVSSFLASQKDIFESVLRVTGTKEGDWQAKYVDHEERYDEGEKQQQAGDRMGFAKVLYTRVFFPNGDGNFEAKYGLHNDILGLPKGNIDDATKAAFEYGQVPL
ncbi:NAD(P)-binding protein [Rhizodiscina lignyota]|uniref:NAD(P)-binding protein n=1 Tax=Rhizodiscina lignyota TaxID=1504668 RepID=A0A9P4M9M6_9PEZI|nr:NAD(P)-binding protein [Rhizodiscina lignyota]